MAWFDIFDSKEDAAKQLASYEVGNWSLDRDISAEQQRELENCTSAYLANRYSKQEIVKILDTQHR